LKHYLNPLVEIAPMARRPRSQYPTQLFRGYRIPQRRTACLVSEPVAWLAAGRNGSPLSRGKASLPGRPCL